MTTTLTRPGGPFFDELAVNAVFDWAPSITLTAGGAAVHQSILGDRLRLPLDQTLSEAVTGRGSAIAHPGYVCDVAIGQSTLATQRVKANLFYRGLDFHSFPRIGDTLSTTTEVVGLKQNTSRPGRPATGLAALRITTVDQDGGLVLDFHRCAMLPLSSDEAKTGHNDDLSAIGEHRPLPPDPTATWDVSEFRRQTRGQDFDPARVGTTERSTADVVTSAPELARLTLNIAATHHDYRASGSRLVYGGHTIGLALAQTSRLFPGLVTVLGWQSCDHSGPVRESDTVYSDVLVEDATELPDGRGVVLVLRSIAYAVDDAGEDRKVLDWRYSVLHV